MDTNKTTTDPLNEFNERSFHFQIPAVVLLGSMLPIGIIGNAFAIYIYGFRLKTSNVHLFITFLAVSDIISCLVGIPMEIHRLYFFYNYSDKVACKIEGFFTFMCYICSMLILLVISVERYMKVCRSTKTQMSRKVAKILVGAAFLSSNLLAIPVPVLAVPHYYTLDNGIVVRKCHYHIEEELWWYSCTFFVILISVLTVMFILYWYVLKTAKKHLALTVKRKAQSSTMQVQEPKNDKKQSQTNRTVLWISVVYMASCIPIFTIAMVTKYFTHLKPPNQLDFFLFFLFESWIINCTLNPVVYGFFNGKFRAEFRNLFNVICGRISFFKMDSSESNTTG